MKSKKKMLHGTNKNTLVTQIVWHLLFNSKVLCASNLARKILFCDLLPSLEI